MDTTVVMTGLIALVMNSRTRPVDKPMVAAMVPHAGHTAFLMMDLEDLELKNAPPADLVVPGGNKGWGLWYIKDEVTLDETSSTLELKPKNGAGSILDESLDLQAVSGDDGIGRVDALVHVTMRSGEVAARPGKKLATDWKFCPVDGNDAPQCPANPKHKEKLADEILWRVNATGIHIGQKAYTFAAGKKPLIHVFNEPGDIAPESSKVLVHMKGIYKDVLGQQDTSKWLLPFNDALPTALLTKRPANARAALNLGTYKFPSAPERCPYAIAFRSRN